MGRPRPEDFGIHGDIKTIKKEIEAKSVGEHRKQNAKYLAINVLISVTLIAIAGNSESLEFLAVIGFGSIIGIGFFQLASIWDADGKAYLETDKNYQNILEYERAVATYERERRLMMAHYWDDLDGHQFERAFADACRLRGYTAYVSPAGGDGGIDLILNKDGHEIVVQCKAHKRKIGPAPIRDLYGVMASEGYTEGWVVSKTGFSDNAKAFAKGKLIKLMDLNDVIAFAGKGFYKRYGVEEEPETKPKESAKTVAAASKAVPAAANKAAKVTNNKEKPQNKIDTLDEAAYDRARYINIIKCICSLLICISCSLIFKWGFENDKFFPVFSALPALWSAILFIICLIWGWPKRNDPNSFSREKEWLRKNDTRFKDS